MITLLIPTMNRSDFLYRLLLYYANIGFQGCICIGDSSNTEHVERTKRAIKGFQGKLNIVYREYPNLNPNQCVRQLLDFVSTPYVALLPDDDLIVPNALEKCTNFLDSHPDYSAAHGMAVIVNIQSGGPYGQFEGVGNYRLPVIEGESASQRLQEHLSNYAVTLFAVHRVESWRVMTQNAALIADKSFAELLPCCLSVILGKVKQLDYLYLLRQDHVQRYLLPDLYDWITGSNWLPSYQVFFDCLSEELAKKDGISIEEARAVVKQAFWAYLARGMMRKWQSKYARTSSGNRNRLLQAACAIPGARQVWRTLRSLSPGKRDEISLPMLLRPSSSYHADFMPIYRAVTMKPTRVK